MEPNNCKQSFREFLTFYYIYIVVKYILRIFVLHRLMLKHTLDDKKEASSNQYPPVNIQVEHLLLSDVV